AIRIAEREPAAIVQSSKARYLLDDQAQVLSLVEDTQYSDLPILRGVSSTFPTVRDPEGQQKIRDGIQVGHLLARAFNEVPTVNVEQASMIVASIKALRFQFGESIEAQWQRFQTLSPSIQEHMTREATEVDLRYAGKVILRKRE
ncbi:MAG: cell division protein FtsQ/DivIB, partial [Nitrospirales bacterium]